MNWSTSVQEVLWEIKFRRSFKEWQMSFIQSNVSIWFYHIPNIDVHSFTQSLKSKSCLFWIQWPFWSRAFIGGAVFSSLVFTTIPTFSLSMVSPCPHKFVYALRPKKWPFETEQPSPLSADGRRHTDAFSSLHSVSFFVRRECEKVFPKKTTERYFLQQS